jgi:hypothetical protein
VQRAYPSCKLVSLPGGGGDRDPRAGLREAFGQRQAQSAPAASYQRDLPAHIEQVRHAGLL